LGAYRAVKIVSRSSFPDQRPFERELSGIRKFEPISRSHHGFVDVLHVGINEERTCFYYIMELGDDLLSAEQINPKRYAPKTLAKVVAQHGKLSCQECLRLGMALSDALAEIHEHGLVHRDVKPSNVIFVQGVPKLADIGLVTNFHEANSYVGTEGFIPPEGPGKPQADIYGLGKTLYEASTGKDRLEFPEFPSEWERSPEHDQWIELNEVLLKACRNDIRKRYQSASDMHADLELAASGGSVKRLNLLEERFARLKRGARIAMPAVAALAVLSFPLYREWRASLEARERQVGASVAYGTRAVESGDLSGALTYFDDALRLEDTDSDRQKLHRLRFGSVFRQCPKLVQLWSASKYVNAASFSPDGQTVLVVEWLGQARIFDANTGQPVSPLFGQTNGLTFGAYSPDGALVVTVSENKTACIWKANDGTKVSCLGHPDKVLTASFSPDGSRLVTGCMDGIARVWDVNSSDLIFSLKEHTNAILLAAFNREGDRIVTTSRDNTARIWDARDGHRLGDPLKHPNWVVDADFSPGGKALVTACSDHRARVWDLTSGKEILPDLNHHDAVNSAQFSPDGRLIVTAGFDGVVRLWLAETHQPLSPNSVLRHSDRVTHAAFARDAHRIVTTCTDGTVRIWDLAGSVVVSRALPNTFSEDKGRFLTISNNEIQVWDAISKQAIGPLMNAGSQSRQATLSADGRFILLRTVQLKAESVEVWEADTGQHLGPPLVLTNKVGHLSLSRDGKRLLVCRGNRAQVWDIATALPVGQAVSHNEAIRSGIFSPEGETVASWSGGTVKVWNAATGQPVFGPLLHPFPVRYVAFSPGGSRLVTCGADPYLTKCYAQVWNTANGQPVGAQLKHGDGIVCAAFSPDGHRIATGSEDFTAIVWDTETGRQITSAMRHENVVQTVAFSPNGKWVITASPDKTVRVWSAESGDPLTPPLQHLEKPAEARFLPTGTQVVTADLKGQVWIWDLSIENKPVADCIRLARLLSGGSIIPRGQLSARRSESPESPLTLWRQLRIQYSSDFTVSLPEIEAWHRFQAEDSELRRQWSAAAFHWECLRVLHPGDQSISEHLARIKGRRNDF
jgi:WD40 repeat protein